MMSNEQYERQVIPKCRAILDLFSDGNTTHLNQAFVCITDTLLGVVATYVEKGRLPPAYLKRLKELTNTIACRLAKERGVDE